MSNIAVAFMVTLHPLHEIEKDGEILLLDKLLMFILQSPLPRIKEKDYG